MYFKEFPFVNYKFGDEVNPVVFQKLSAYVDILDKVKNAGAFYQKVFIQQEERPDTLSYKLYGTVDYYWTFFLLNDHIRLSGWPLSRYELYKLAETYYPNKAIITKDEIYTTFTVGTQFNASSSGLTGTVVKRNLDLGQLIVDIGTQTGDFTAGEIISYTDGDGNSVSTEVFTTSDQSEATHHYEDTDGVQTDIDPFLQNGGLLENVTYRDHLYARNEELKQIIAIRPSQILQVVAEFNSHMKGR